MTLVDTNVAALYAGVTPRTIRRWVHAGMLANHGTPRRIRIALEELTQAQRCTATPMSASV